MILYNFSLSIESLEILGYDKDIFSSNFDN